MKAPQKSPGSRSPKFSFGRQVLVKPGHVEARHWNFSPSAIPPWPGNGLWIWLNEAQCPLIAPVAALFRKEVHLKDAPCQVHAWLSADPAYRLSVNGRVADRGPDDLGIDYREAPATGNWLLGYRDLTPFFKAGKNILAVEVFSVEAMAAINYLSRGHGGWLFEAKVELPNHEDMVLISDESWQGIVAPQWAEKEWRPASRECATKVLHFEAAKEPQGWRTGEFSNHWPACSLVQNIWTPQVLSEIPPRMEAFYPHQDIVRATESVRLSEGAIFPITLEKAGGFAVRYDRVLCGYIRLRICGGAGASVEIQPSELDQPGFHRMAVCQLRSGVQECELPFYDSFSVINITVRDVSEPIVIREISTNFTSYPVSYRGSFTCSDPEMNRIWEVSRWLTQMCLQSHHLDSPNHQEPLSDPGDYLIQALNTYYAFGEPWLARQDLRKFAWLLRRRDFKPFHTSYALLWLQMLIDYGDYTGDTVLWSELAPEVHDLLETFASFRGPNGLLCNAPNYMFMDWVNIGGYEGHHPPAVIGQGYLSAFYYRALADAKRLAEFQGDTARAAGYGLLRRQIHEAYQRELWDETTGLYRDGKPFQTSVAPAEWLPADADIETHSAQNNSLAVLYGLAPANLGAGIMRRVLSGPGFNCQPYFMHFVFGALDCCGLFETEAVPQMRRWKVAGSTQSFREMWDAGDYSHSWQCSPMYQLSSRVLGVTPLEPGFKTVEIRPRTCGLQWAAGVVPTPHGPVSIEWEWINGQLHLEYSVPDGVEAVVVDDRA